MESGDAGTGDLMRCHRHAVDMVVARTDARGGYHHPRQVFRCPKCVAEARDGIRYQRAHNWLNVVRRGVLHPNGEALWNRPELWVSLKPVIQLRLK